MRYLVSLVLTIALCSVSQAQQCRNGNCQAPAQAPRIQKSALPVCNCVNCPLAGACNGTCGVAGCGVQRSAYSVRVVQTQTQTTTARRPLLGGRLFTGKLFRGGCR